ncbi:hypothetical protein GCM10027586_07460 [Kineococcus gypseus]|uniref:YybH family protein n=1 Tax=Kineococcus gypseus TaxID=1637102 RepID=UPI003D7DCED7
MSTTHPDTTHPDTTHPDTAHPDTAAELTVARSQRDWILRWDKRPDQQLGAFEDVFAEHYDFDAPVILFDDFDPQRRVFRTVRDYAEAFWPGFQRMRSAEHGIEVEPEVLVSGDLAATRMVFTAVLELADGTVVANRCTNSQVWRRTGGLGWRIARDYTSVAAVEIEAARRLVAAGR